MRVWFLGVGGWIRCEGWEFGWVPFFSFLALQTAFSGWDWRVAGVLSASQTEVLQKVCTVDSLHCATCGRDAGLMVYGHRRRYEAGFTSRMNESNPLLLASA